MTLFSSHCFKYKIHKLQLPTRPVIDAEISDCIICSHHCIYLWNGFRYNRIQQGKHRCGVYFSLQNLRFLFKSNTTTNLTGVDSLNRGKNQTKENVSRLMKKCPFSVYIYQKQTSFVFDVQQHKRPLAWQKVCSPHCITRGYLVHDNVPQCSGLHPPWSKAVYMDCSLHKLLKWTPVSQFDPNKSKRLPPSILLQIFDRRLGFRKLWFPLMSSVKQSPCFFNANSRLNFSWSWGEHGSVGSGGSKLSSFSFDVSCFSSFVHSWSSNSKTDLGVSKTLDMLLAEPDQ